VQPNVDRAGVGGQTADCGRLADTSRLAVVIGASHAAGADQEIELRHPAAGTPLEGNGATRELAARGRAGNSSWRQGDGGGGVIAGLPPAVTPGTHPNLIP